MPDIKRLISQNNSASYEYFIEDVYEAGIILTGTEVKSLRRNNGSLKESHADIEVDAAYIYNLHIPEYTEANRFNHYPKRPRKLLLHKKEIKKLIGAVKKKGATLIPLKIYFNSRNLVKLSLALAIGKKKHDKRQAIKEREWKRDKERLLKNQ